MNCWLASQQNREYYKKQPFKASGNSPTGNQQMKKKSTKFSKKGQNLCYLNSLFTVNALQVSKMENSLQTTTAKNTGSSLPPGRNQVALFLEGADFNSSHAASVPIVEAKSLASLLERWGFSFSVQFPLVKQKLCLGCNVPRTLGPWLSLPWLVRQLLHARGGKSRGFQAAGCSLTHPPGSSVPTVGFSLRQTFAIVPTSISRAPTQRLCLGTKADYVIDSSYSIFIGAELICNRAWRSSNLRALSRTVELWKEIGR